MHKKNLRPKITASASTQNMGFLGSSKAGKAPRPEFQVINHSWKTISKGKWRIFSRKKNIPKIRIYTMTEKRSKKLSPAVKCKLPKPQKYWAKIWANYYEFLPIPDCFRAFLGGKFPRSESITPFKQTPLVLSQNPSKAENFNPKFEDIRRSPTLDFFLMIFPGKKWFQPEKQHRKSEKFRSEYERKRTFQATSRTWSEKEATVGCQQ